MIGHCPARLASTQNSGVCQLDIFPLGSYSRCVGRSTSTGPCLAGSGGPCLVLVGRGATPLSISDLSNLFRPGKNRRSTILVTLNDTWNVLSGMGTKKLINAPQVAPVQKNPGQLCSTLSFPGTRRQIDRPGGLKGGLGAAWGRFVSFGVLKKGCPGSPPLGTARMARRVSHHKRGRGGEG